MKKERTKEPQYGALLDLRDAKGISRLGLMTNQVWHDDPRRLAILLSRYKFVAKMLSGKRRALEVGCGDAFGARIVRQETESLCAVDFDPLFIKDALSRQDARWPLECKIHDILSGPVPGLFDAAYSLDVLEHIRPEDEDSYIANICASLEQNGVLIIGTPSIQSQAYASPQSKEGHINCKDHKTLRDLISRRFHNVFIFSMNDEVVHTGFYPMAHYLFALGVGRKG